MFIVNVQTVSSNLKQTKNPKETNKKNPTKTLLVLQLYLLHASAELLMRTCLGTNKSFILIITPLCSYSEVIHIELIMG